MTPRAFGAVITSQQAQCYKPNTPIFGLALRHLDEPPQKIVHIAEGLCEARPAKQLGMKSTWVKRSSRSDDGSGATPHATTPNLITPAMKLKMAA